MSDLDNRQWWRDLFRRDVLAGHVVNALVALGVGFVVTLAGAVSWVAWAAWRGSYLWTQRAIGASMAFAVVIVAIALALAIIRQRLRPARPIAPKGYLDHEAEIKKSRDIIIKLHTGIARVISKETKWITANTERLKKLQTLPYNKQLPAKLAISRRTAHSTDKTTKKLAALAPRLAIAGESYANAELAYWTWHSATNRLSPEDALAKVSSLETQIDLLTQNLASQEAHKTAIAGRRGESQILNEAVDRRLEVMDRQIAAVASQIAPLREVVTLLTPVTAGPIS